MKLYLSIVLFLLTGTAEVKGQAPVLIEDAEFQEVARAAIDSLYNRNPAAAHELLEPWSSRYPEHPLWLLWDAMDHWWKVLTDLYDHSNDELLFEKLDKASKAADRLLEESPGHPDSHIIQAVANGYIARHNANRERWVRSVRTGRTAYRAHIELEKAAPDLADNLFAKGLKEYYSAYLPEAYRVVRAVSWLLPDGDKAEGLRLLEYTSREAVFARPEANYFLGMILLNYEGDYEKAMNLFQSLVDYYPNNSYYRRLLVRSLHRHNMISAAEQEIDRALEHWARNNFADELIMKEELLYWKGRILMQTGEFDEAYRVFVNSYRIGLELPNREKRRFHALSGYYAGLTAERNGDKTAARNFYRAVTQLECEPEARERARERMRNM
jgi:tetratricopeptide (TPR) repeat protein